MSSVAKTPDPRSPETPLNPNRRRSRSTSAWIEEIRNTRTYNSTPLLFPHSDPKNKFRVALSRIVTAVVYYCFALPFTIVKIIMSTYTEHRYRKRQMKRFENALQFTEDGVTWYKAAMELDKLRGYDDWRQEEETVSATSGQKRGALADPSLPVSPKGPKFLCRKPASWPGHCWNMLRHRAIHKPRRNVRIDAKALIEETRAMRELTASGNQTAVGEYMRTHFLRDALGMGAQELYLYYAGSKDYVEEYLQAAREMIQHFSMDSSATTIRSASASGSGRSSLGVPSAATPTDSTIGSSWTNLESVPTSQLARVASPSSLGGSRASPAPQPRGAPLVNLVSASNVVSASTDNTPDSSTLTDHSSIYTQSMLDFAYKNRVPGSVGYAMTVPRRLALLEATSQSMGRTALMLSGGASLGMYHVGVVRALYEANLLPKIVSGSSAGAIVGGVICCKGQEELEEVILDGMKDTYFKAFEEIEQAELNVMTKMKRLLQSGGFMDVNQLVKCMRTNCGDLTFAEANKKTGRIFNVSVAADREGDKATLLNYLTTPNVLIWSAVVASCCMPGLYKKYQLSQKDPETQQIIPYMEGQLWFDGSVANDLPRRQLTEMFHCSFFVVSQVNPHVIPFVKNNTPSIHKKPTGWIKSLWFSGCAEAGHWGLKLAELAHHNAALSGRVTEWCYSLLKQEYTGDVTVFPIGSVWDAIPDFVNLTTNPTQGHMMYVGSKGMRRTLPHVHQIRCMTEVERVLDFEIERLRKQVRINNKTEELRRGGKML